MRTLPAILLALVGILAYGQSPADPGSDTTRVLTLDALYAVILRTHPVARQAALLSEQARQEIRLARGGFDPKLDVFFESKEFQDKSYYQLFDGSVSFPSWLPLNPKAGYERNEGELLDPSQEIPGGEQLYAGVHVPLGKGLFTDERRTTVRQAELFGEAATVEQISILNELLLQAAKDYWNWYYGYYNYRYTSSGISLATEVLNRTRLSFAQGEASAQDTLQALTILQSRRVDWQEAYLNFLNAGVAVSNYLWTDEGAPIALDPAIVPELTVADQYRPTRIKLDALIDQAMIRHPDLQKIEIKLSQLELDRKLAAEQLKPRFDVGYYLLSQPSAPVAIDPMNDYRLKVDFSIPILLRKERSKISLIKLKVENMKFEQVRSSREIANRIRMGYNALSNLGLMVEQQESMVSLYQELLRNELRNLDRGESDLFRINFQLEKLLQAQGKLAKSHSEYFKSLAELYWAAGVRNLSFITAP